MEEAWSAARASAAERDACERRAVAAEQALSSAREGAAAAEARAGGTESAASAADRRAAALGRELEAGHADNARIIVHRTST